ncbi:hypothetical protein [Sphingopyxis sp.]|uniref:hypothetical protein n=1 Tax=Sphingopyxis sp. TaxID=1908224 RepID=UPI002D77C47B|nr:hypothetical protein [Sphingopyxis sp.]HET6523100.1 hypothetical protein [Sphingopyxis sp.]
MYKLMAFFRKHPSLNREQFIEAYEQGEIPVILQAGGAPLLYRRSYPRRPIGPHGSDSGDATEFGFDVLTEIGFPDKAAADEWFAKVNSPEVESVAHKVFHSDHVVFAFEVEEHDSSASKQDSK